MKRSILETDGEGPKEDENEEAPVLIASVQGLDDTIDQIS